MKRNLIQNVKAIPYTSGGVIDRTGFLSAVVAVSALAAGNVKLEVTHADAAVGTFEAVTDERLVLNGPSEVKDLKAGDITNFDLDLLGCKHFIKVTLSGTAAATGSGDTAKTAACAVVLGDAVVQPV